MRAAIYCRVSTSGQEDNYSLPTQEEACRTFAKEHGFTITDVYRDVHSGYELWERPRLTALREAARAGEVEAIVAYDPDRLSRRQVYFAVLVEECERYGVELLFVHGQFEKNALGEFLGNVRAFVAEMEREKFRERSQRGMLARMQSGKLRPSNRPLYGYRWADDDKGQYLIDDEKAAVVRQIFEMAVGGQSLRSIARRLDDAGVPTPNAGVIWKHVVVRGILRHEAYKGVAIANKYANTKVGGKRRTIERPPEEHIALPPGTIPPIVSEEVWEAVQTRLVRNKAEASRNNRDPEAFLLRSGFIVCGYCGRRVHTAWHKARNGRPHRPSYAVMQSSVEHHDCPYFSISATMLDNAVWEGIRHRILREDVIAHELARLQQEDPSDANLAAIERILAEIARKQTNLSRSLAAIDDHDAAAPLVAELKALAARKRELESERDQVRDRQAGWRSSQQQLLSLQEWVRTVAENLDELDYARKRDLLAALDVRVNLYRADHEPRWEARASLPLDGAPIVLVQGM
jgi:site-specific DNA recombinase